MSELSALHQELRKGADPDAIQQALKPSDLLEEDEVGRTPLHWLVANQGSLKLVELFLGMSPEAATRLCHQARMPMHWAARNKSSPEIIDALLQAAPIALQTGDNAGRLPIHLAAARGNAETVKKLHSSDPAGLLKRDKHGAVPLVLAVVGRQPCSVVSMILELEPASATVKDNCGNMALHCMALKGYGAGLDVAKALLAAAPQAATETEMDGKLPLHCASGNGAAPEVVEALILANPGGAKMPDSGGRVPLHYAAAKQASAAVVQALLAASPSGAELYDAAGNLPLHWAAATQASAETLRLLVAAAPTSVQKPDADGQLAIHHAVSSRMLAPEALAVLVEADPGTLSRHGAQGKQPLHLALLYQAGEEVVKLLTAASPGCVSAADTEGNLPIHLAVGHHQGADPAVVEQLLQVDPGTVEAKDKNSLLPLHAACARGSNTAVVKVLLAAGPSLILRDDGEGRLPLHLAAAHGAAPDMIYALLQADHGSVKAKDHAGWLPLQVAAANNAPVPSALMLAEADPGSLLTAGAEGMLALHYAAANAAHPDLIAALAKAEPRAVLVPDSQGKLPIHWALSCDASAEAVNALVLASPVSLECPDAEQRLPLHVAVAFKPSLGVIQQLVDSNPRAILARSGDGNLPLHIAASTQASLDVVQLLLSTSPDSVLARAGLKAGLAEVATCDGCGVCPIVGRRYSSPSRVDFDLCRTCADQENMPWSRENLTLICFGDLPIHLAASSHASRDVLQALCQAASSSLQTPGWNGRLPLHAAAEHCQSADAFMDLMDGYREAVSIQDEDGCLPLHYAAVQGNPAVVKALVDAHTPGLRVLDKKGQLPARVAIMHKATVEAVKLLLDLQMADVSELAKYLPVHELVQVESYAPVVEELLQSMPQLGRLQDHTGRAVMDIAHPVIRQMLCKAAYFLQRYELQRGRPVHQSRTSMVWIADDHGDEGGAAGQGSQEPLSVALKFISSSKHVERELAMRRGLNREFVVMPFRLHVESGHLSEEIAAAAAASGVAVVETSQLYADLCRVTARSMQSGPAMDHHSPGKASALATEEEKEGFMYNYVLVMDCADRTLHDALVHEGFAGKNLSLVVRVVTDVIEALQHLREQGVVHGDLKLLNVVRVGETWKLIDFDCSARHCDRYGDKRPSTGICPPEVIQGLLQASDPCARVPDNVRASFSHDLWSLGALVYYLAKGKSLWSVELTSEDLDASGMTAVAAWGSNTVQDCREERLSALMNVASSWPAAALCDLLGKLLDRDPESRMKHFNTPRTILDSHPFFSGESQQLADIIKGQKVLVEEVQKGIGAIQELATLVHRLQDASSSKQVSIEELSAQIASGFLAQQSATRGILEAVVGLSENVCPTVFVVAPRRWQSPASWFSSAGEGAGAADKCLDSLLHLISSLQDPEATVLSVFSDMLHETFVLRLVCQSCCAPQGAGYEIERPTDIAQELIPMLQMSVKALTFLDIGLGIAKCFLPFLPTVPEAVKIKLDRVCQSLSSSGEHNSSLLAETSSPDEAAKARVGASMREFLQFLNDKDPDRVWGSLSKVVLDGSGSTIWVCQACLSAQGSNLIFPQTASVSREQQKEAACENREQNGRGGSNTSHAVAAHSTSEDATAGTNQSAALSHHHSGTAVARQLTTAVEKRLEEVSAQLASQHAQLARIEGQMHSFGPQATAPEVNTSPVSTAQRQSSSNSGLQRHAASDCVPAIGSSTHRQDAAQSIAIAQESACCNVQ